MRIEKAATLIVASVFILLLLWLVVQILKPEPFPVGATMPVIYYAKENGLAKLRPDSTKKTAIMYFHRRCKSCLYEIQQFDSLLVALEGIKIIFLTSDRTLFKSNFRCQWPALAAMNVEWGIVKKQEFKEAFGSVGVPYLYFFDERGVLYHKIRGEVRIERVVEVLNYN